MPRAKSAKLSHGVTTLSLMGVAAFAFFAAAARSAHTATLTRSSCCYAAGIASNWPSLARRTTPSDSSAKCRSNSDASLGSGHNVVPERATPNRVWRAGARGSRTRSNCYRMDAIVLTFTALTCGCVTTATQVRQMAAMIMSARFIRAP